MDLVDPESLNYAVWETQGKALVRRQKGSEYIFIRAPICQCQQYKVGDKMPSSWKFWPVNAKARVLQESMVTAP